MYPWQIADDISEMHQDKMENQFKVSIPESRHTDHLSVATKLLTAKQELEEVSDALKIKKEVRYYLTQTEIEAQSNF